MEAVCDGLNAFLMDLNIEERDEDVVVGVEADVDVDGWVEKEPSSPSKSTMSPSPKSTLIFQPSVNLS